MCRAPLLLLLAACTNASAPTAPGHASAPALSLSLSHVPVPVPDPSPAPSAPSPADPPPAVKLATIGMHVGGGPYDEITKEPMKRSVEPRLPDLARCWKLVSRPAAADVGVDLVIEAKGGRARVSNPRTSVTSDGFVPCVVSFFERVEFLEPKNGKTVVSYSVRFTPTP